MMRDFAGVSREGELRDRDIEEEMGIVRARIKACALVPASRGANRVALGCSRINTRI